MTKIVFAISPSAVRVELTKDVLGKNWVEKSQVACMLVAGGTVDDSDPSQLVCKQNANPIVTLIGASWDSSPTEGDALVNDCVGAQRWHLESQ